jgi:hypothetical protein
MIPRTTRTSSSGQANVIRIITILMYIKNRLEGRFFLLGNAGGLTRFIFMDRMGIRKSNISNYEEESNKDFIH